MYLQVADTLSRDLPAGSDGKASIYNAGDLGSIPGSGRFPRDGNDKPLQYSCLENPMDGGAWCRLLSMRSQRVGHDWETSLHYSHAHPSFTLTLKLPNVYCLMAFLCLQNIGLNSFNAFETLLKLLDILISDYILHPSSPSTYFPSLSSKPLPPWRGFPCSSVSKNPLAMKETQVWFLGWKDSLEKEMATHFSILAWSIPWTEEPDRL